MKRKIDYSFKKRSMLLYNSLLRFNVSTLLVRFQLLIVNAVH
ncbi:hypothetical protein JIP1600_390021 [Flavobacterium psychrophilum]|nr:hypothetical protein JIP1600_390021 [Flavobacterium psychrophilum]